jgi:hypothetical protein
MSLISNDNYKIKKGAFSILDDCSVGYFGPFPLSNDGNT